MSPPHRQSVARISEELGIHVITLYKWRKAWRLQGEVVPASETVTARKDDVPAADQAAITNVVGLVLFSGSGGLIQTTSG